VVKLVKIFINGFGNIGRRLATYLDLDKEIDLVGIAKYNTDVRAKEAISKGYKIYIPKNLKKSFEDKKIQYAGYIEDGVRQSDLIIDAAKEGLGYENKQKIYLPMDKKAIFQGGEKREGKFSVADMIHNSRVNYDKAKLKHYVIQGSCNVSGMGRMIEPLIENFGDSISRFDVTLIRRWADLEDSKEVKDSIEWDAHPHHQDDVKDFLPKVNLYVEAFKVPSRMMHVHQMLIRFKNRVTSKDKILEIFQKEFGVAILKSSRGTAEVRKKAMDLGFIHGDTNMVHIHENLLRLQDDTLKLVYSDDQTGMVIPENHLLIQSMVSQKTRSEALQHTDLLFDMTKRKEILQDAFK